MHVFTEGSCHLPYLRDGSNFTGLKKPPSIGNPVSWKADEINVASDDLFDRTQTPTTRQNSTMQVKTKERCRQFRATITTVSPPSSAKPVPPFSNLKPGGISLPVPEVNVDLPAPSVYVVAAVAFRTLIIE